MVFTPPPSKIEFSGSVTVFCESVLPEPATPAGYAALIHAYHLKVPLPRMLSATSEHHRMPNADDGEAMVERKPTGTYTRRIWFLSEWLLGN